MDIKDNKTGRVMDIGDWMQILASLPGWIYAVTPLFSAGCQRGACGFCLGRGRSMHSELVTEEVQEGGPTVTPVVMWKLARGRSLPEFISYRAGVGNLLGGCHDHSKRKREAFILSSGTPYSRKIALDEG